MMSRENAARPVVLIAGPTASGKSQLALSIAERFDGAVINADSMQVYRELRILTARPGEADAARVPHRLYGGLAAADPCSAARWRAMAVEAVAEVTAAGRLPLLVGGTGLYFRAFAEGLADIPPVPAEVRAAAQARRRDLGPEAFHAELAVRDPVLGGRLAPGDTQRVLRAWEVVEATGRPLSAWQETAPESYPGRVITLVLDPPRQDLYAACDARVPRMVAEGALDEVTALVRLGLDPALPAMRALGVPELAAHLRGELSLDAATAAMQQATRRYAKRQTTWFRHQMADAYRITATDLEAQVATAMMHLEKADQTCG